MFEQLDVPAQRAVVLAQEEARSMRHGIADLEHLLLGVLLAEDASGVARPFGLDPSVLRAKIFELHPEELDFAGTVAFSSAFLAVTQTSGGSGFHPNQQQSVSNTQLLLAMLDQPEKIQRGLLLDRSDIERVKLATLKRPHAGQGGRAVRSQARIKEVPGALEQFATASMLADALGHSIYVPNPWPAGTEEPMFFRSHATGVSTHYQVTAVIGAENVLLDGTLESADTPLISGDRIDVADLECSDHVIVRRYDPVDLAVRTYSGHIVRLLWFPTVNIAIEVCRNLQLVLPVDL